jgi:peptide/nickel transport system permease protein
MGVPTRLILFKELLPNMVAPIVVSISLGHPGFVTAEAGLS